MGNIRNKKSTCIVCGKVWDTWNTDKIKNVCSPTCRNELKYRSFIERWLKHEINGSGKCSKMSAYSVRYVLERADNRCEKCGFNTVHPRTGKRILQIHHIDENPENSIPENLIVLCPNCHALTDSKNTHKGNGRRYYREIFKK